MTFVNFALLPLLAIVAIPVIIHLLNRRKAQLVDWGAMRFLLASLASRNRRILIEELILLIVRCLLLALLALAIARPFVPSQTAVPWGLVLPSVLGAALLLALAGAFWNRRARRWALLGVALSLLGLAGGLTAYETVFQANRWRGSGGQKDLAIIVDGSMSMQVSVNGKTHFQRAIEEARSVLASCRAGDAVSIVLASSRSRAILGQPTCDRKAAESALASLTPGRGSMKVLEALNLAVEECLAKGTNPTKKILLITDGQSIGWDTQSEHRWKFLAAAMRGGRLQTPPRIVCRTLGLPKAFHNLAVSEIAPGRRVIGTDRKLTLDVKVTNTGASPAAGTVVELVIDGLSPLKEKVAQVQPNASEAVHFEYRFDKPGRHLLTAAVKFQDDLTADNTDWRVVNVIDRLNVLLIDGAPSRLPMQGSADFIEVALQPQAKGATGGTPVVPAPTPRPTGETPVAPDDFQCLVETTTVAMTEVGKIADLSPYRVVILANVPQLPSKFAQDIEQFVREGGGLLIAAGQNVDRDFYNRWTAGNGQRVCPAPFEVGGATATAALTSMDNANRPVAAEPLPLDVKSFTHPALAKLADAGKSDAASGRVYTYWPLKPDARDAAVRVAGGLESSAPLLVERKLGKGCVFQSAICFDAHDSNLPSLRCFVPLMHELVYYLAEPTVEDPNIPPGAEVVVDLAGPRRGGSPAAAAPPVGGAMPEVVLPSKAKQPMTVAGAGAARRASFSATGEPGLYRLMLPEAWYALLGQPALAKAGLPVVVASEPGESRLSTLTKADFDRLRKYLDVFQAETIDEMTAAIGGNTPGQELWKYLAIGVLLALVAEIVLTRWIAQQRRTNSTEAVAFGQEILDVRGYRERAKEMLRPAGEAVGISSKQRVARRP